MKKKIIQLLLAFTLLSSVSFAQSNNLSGWVGGAFAEDQELSIFTSIKLINWFYGNGTVDTDDVLAQTWPVLNAAQLGYNFSDTQDYKNYVYSSTVTAIDLYYIRQANITLGANTVQDAIDANHPVMAQHYNSTTGYTYVTIICYGTSGYSYWDPVTASPGYDVFSNFVDAVEITGVI